MSIQLKYAKLLEYAKSAGISDLSVQEQSGVLYVNGTASQSAQTELWNIYNTIDPDMRAGDLILNIQVAGGGETLYEVTKNDNLSTIAKKYPGMTWQKIFEANKDILKDPNKIFPGQKIRIPL